MRLALVLVVLVGCGGSEIEGTWTDKATLTLALTSCQGRVCDGSVTPFGGSTPDSNCKSGAEQAATGSRAFKLWVECGSQIGNFSGICTLSDDSQTLSCACDEFGGCPATLSRVRGS